jgi:hypothetical protein
MLMPYLLLRIHKITELPNLLLTCFVMLTKQTNINYYESKEDYPGRPIHKFTM